MNKNILLCGVGGQGTVLASKLLAAAAMEKGIPVMSAETIGMAQKGGSVFSHLRMGEGLYAPMLRSGTADLIIGFEPAEAVRMLPYLAEGGSVVVSSTPVIPVTSVLKTSPYDGSEMIAYLKKQVRDLIVIDGAAACREVGSPKALNMVLLGAALGGGVLPFTTEEIKNVMQKRVKPQFYELNCRALDYAAKTGKEGN
ncbi:MAG: indolepyruvate oxidoreductase subunit beta [Oscillospiraceae bacterium]|nr:indolepyruvate oxidoreductase subunit beta [Oscillospiraceae bacterium]